jgi:hypothetical protein
MAAVPHRFRPPSLLLCDTFLHHFSSVSLFVRFPARPSSVSDSAGGAAACACIGVRTCGCRSVSFLSPARHPELLSLRLSLLSFFFHRSASQLVHLFSPVNRLLFVSFFFSFYFRTCVRLGLSRSSSSSRSLHHTGSVTGSHEIAIE